MKVKNTPVSYTHLIRAIQENPLEDAIVIGVEPESLDVGFEPSAPVQKALPEVSCV